MTGQSGTTLEAAADGARFATIAQAAVMLGISYRGVNRLIQHGELGYVRVGGRRKIEIAELERYIAARRVPARGAP